MEKEKMVTILQRKWDRENQNYSEDGFKDQALDFIDENDDVGFFLNEDGEMQAVCDWVLNKLDLSR